MKTNLLILPLILLLSLGCRHLDPAGVYKGDQFLYQTDEAIVTGYDALHLFVSWEYRNRQLLSGTPQVKAAADRVRKDSKAWFKTAYRLRDAYAANPTPEARSALSDALRVINQALQESLDYLTKYAVKPN